MTRRLVLTLAVLFALVACSAPAATPTPIPTPVAVATPIPTPVAVATPIPTPVPTVEPTPEPTPSPAEAYTIEEVNEALATEDCEVITSLLGNEDRVGATANMEVLNAAVDALTRCLTGSYEPSEPEPALTAAQENAIESAESYLDYTAFSREGLIDQLKYEGYSKAVATFAVDYLDVNWKEQAYQSALNYLDFTSFSLPGLIDQLEYEGFTKAQAKYGATKAYNE